jgi:hypothetical protein
MATTMRLLSVCSIFWLVLSLSSSSIGSPSVLRLRCQNTHAKIATSCCSARSVGPPHQICRPSGRGISDAPAFDRCKAPSLTLIGTALSLWGDSWEHIGSSLSVVLGCCSCCSIHSSCCSGCAGSPNKSEVDICSKMGSLVVVASHGMVCYPHNCHDTIDEGKHYSLPGFVPN